ncbi:DUF4422 domain-containing protein [Aeromonas dhakensis]|uniref:DUF4422 domain-containing protein n=1 Tax=Aeromonas dhakensis TaxID=196024 RepID=UPI003BA075D4
MTIKLYVAAHKPYSYPSDADVYVPIEVGAGLRDEHFCSVRDDIGDDNISLKNESFCELSAIYWMLRNDNSTHVGLVHYRRHFKLDARSEEKLIGYWGVNSCVTACELEKVFKRYDIIIPKRIEFHENIEQDYKINHFYSDYKITRCIIEDKHPDYLKYFDDFSIQRRIHTCNMFVMPQELFRKCWEWIFSVLFELELSIDISSYDSYQRRVFGFMSERLFNVWVLYAVQELGLRIYESGVINLESKSKVKKFFSKFSKG